MAIREEPGRSSHLCWITPNHVRPLRLKLLAGQTEHVHTPRQFEFRADGRVTWDKSREVPKIEVNPVPKGRTLSNEDVEQVAMRVSCLIAAYLPNRVNKQLTSELAAFIESSSKRNAERDQAG